MTAANVALRFFLFPFPSSPRIFSLPDFFLPQPLGSETRLPFPLCRFPSLVMENTDAPHDDPSTCSSPTQVPTDDCILTPEQMAISSHLALPIGRDGRPVVVNLAPGSTTWIDADTLDPTLLPGLPRVENQYNEDYTDYAQRVHNPAHGSWPVEKPYEEWACRQCGPPRHWFYRSWFHYKTLRWNHDDIEYYKSASGYFLDTHPASYWHTAYYRVWGTRGWQLVLPATQSLPIWEQCEKYEEALRLEQERLAAETNPVMSDTTTTALPRGRKRQAVDNLEHLNVQYQLETLLQNFSQLDVSQTPMLKGLPAPAQHQLIDGVLHTLTTYQDELQQALRRDDPAQVPNRSTAAPSASPGQELPIDPVASGTGLPLPDSGSMSLNSSSTDSQHTLAPPFPPAEGTHD